MKRIGAALLSLVLLLSLWSCGFSYADHSEYVTLAEEGLPPLDLPADYAVTDGEVEEYLHALLLSLKRPVKDGEREYNKPARDGDVLAFYYEGYLDDGTRVTDGFSVGEGAPLEKPYLLELGSGSFPVPALEAALVGVTPSDSRLSVSGQVPAGCTVYLQCYYQEEGGPTQYLFGTGRYDLATADLTMGEGFAAALVGQTVGGFITFDIRDDFDGDGTLTTRTYSVRICYASRGEVTVRGTYPADCEDEGRAGKAVTLFVLPVFMVDYEVPPLTEETVTGEMGLFEDEPDPVAALRREARRALLLEEDRLAVFEVALWEAMEEALTYKSLPEGQIDKLADGLLAEIEEVYLYSREHLYDACVEQFGQEAMQSLDGFARASYQATEGTARELTRAEAERQVKEHLAIYAIGDYYGILPSEAETEEGAAAQLKEALAYSNLSERQLLRRYGGRAYYEAEYCYGYVLAKLAVLMAGE